MQENSLPPTPADMAVIICAYTDERWQDIVDAVESVRSQSKPVKELVLVIDHNDGLLQRARAEFTKGVTIVPNRHKQGLSGARNSGIEASSAPILAFLDDDAIAEPEWAEQLAEPYARPEVVGVGGDIRPLWLEAAPAWWPAEFDWVVGCIYKGHTTEKTEIRNAIGANMSVRRSAFESVGGFSSGLGRVGKHPVGAEETELYIRIRHKWPDTKVIYQPTAIVHHKVSRGRGTWAYFRARCYAEGLSKAVVSKLSDSGENLSSEWGYTLKALPLGALSGVVDGIRGKRNGFGRAGAITAGLAITTAGYVRGRLSKGPERNLVEIPSSDEMT